MVQILETHNEIEENIKTLGPYNILPLDPDSANQAIMRYPEVLYYCFSFVGNESIILSCEVISDKLSSVYVDSSSCKCPKKHKGTSMA